MIGMYPSFSFGLVAKNVCPPGSSIQYAAPSAGDSANSISCLAGDGSSKPGSYDGAVFAFNRMMFLLCFLPTFIPGAILMRLAIHRWSQTASEPENELDEQDDD